MKSEEKWQPVGPGLSETAQSPALQTSPGCLGERQVVTRQGLELGGVDSASGSLRTGSLMAGPPPRDRFHTGAAGRGPLKWTGALAVPWGAKALPQ